MFRAMFTVGGFTLMSRLLGFVRDKLIANLLGGGHLADVWIAAFRLPNLFRRIFGEGAFNSAFVPMYSRKLEENGEAAADDFGGRVTSLMLVILIVCFAVCFVFMEPIVRVIAAGFEGEKFDLAVTASRITLAYLIFVCLMAAFSGVLNSRRVFGTPAFAYVLLNIVFIVGMGLFLPEAFGLKVMEEPATPFTVAESTLTPEQIESGEFALFTGRQVEAIELLGWCVLGAGVLQLGLVVISAYRNGVRFRFHLPKIDSDVKKLGLLMTPGLASAGIQQINLLVGQTVATLQKGGNAMIYYADRINQLPFGLIGIAAGIVLLPEITRALRGDGIEKARENIARGIEMSLLLSLPAMVATLVIPEEMIYAIFKGGKFTTQNAVDAGKALAAFSIGTPAYIIVRVLQTGYFGREDTKTPMRFTIISAISNIVLCYPLYLWMGPAGCALATSVAGWINVILLWVGLQKDGLLRMTLGFTSRATRMLISAALMGGAVWAAAYFTKPWLMAPGNFVQRVGILTVIIAAGAIVYFGFVFATRVYSVADVKAIMRRGGKKTQQSKTES